MPFCFWVTHADRKTDRGRRSPSSCARMTQSICCLSACSRSLKDSVTPTSLGFTTRWNVTHFTFCLYSPRRHASMPVPPSYPSFCQIRSSPPPQPVIHHSRLFYSTRCYVWRLEAEVDRELGCGGQGCFNRVAQWKQSKLHKTQEQRKKSESAKVHKKCRRKEGASKHSVRCNRNSTAESGSAVFLWLCVLSSVCPLLQKPLFSPG